MTGTSTLLRDMSSIVVMPVLLAAAVLLWLTPAPASRLSVIAERPGAELAVDRRRNPWRRRAMFGGFAVASLWVLAGPVVSAVVLGAVAVVMIVSARAKARRDDIAIRLAVYELCRAVAGELRTGSTPARAFRSAVAASPEPLRSGLRPATDFVGDAEPAEFADVLTRVAASRPALVGLARLAACWRVVVAAGAMLAPAIDRVADALRDEVDLGQALATSLAAPRATVRLLAALPLFGLTLGVAIGARPVAFLVGSPAGLGCLAFAGAFDVAGVVWARRITSRATAPRPVG